MVAPPAVAVPLGTLPPGAAGSKPARRRLRSHPSRLANLAAEQKCRDSGRPDLEYPYSERPDFGQPDLEYPYSERPDFGQPDLEYPYSERPDFGRPHASPAPASNPAPAALA